jgi:hypothetical protein
LIDAGISLHDGSANGKVEKVKFEVAKPVANQALSRTDPCVAKQKSLPFLRAPVATGYKIIL